MKQKLSNVRFKRVKTQKQLARPDGIKRASKYNNTVMKDDTIQVHQGFAKRLSSIRTMRGLSAREMSLSLGQGAGYINNIENGRNLPSMAMFFEICEYLDLSPGEFFDYSIPDNGNLRQLLASFAGLDSESQELIITIAEKLKKG